MFRRYLERLSWADVFLRLFQIFLIFAIILGIINTVRDAKYTSAQWGTLVFAGLAQGSIYALIALGFAVIYKTVRFFNLAHGAVYTVGAYSAYTMTIQIGVNPIISFFLPRR